jgi:hypothetical protein
MPKSLPKTGVLRHEGWPTTTGARCSISISSRRGDENHSGRGRMSDQLTVRGDINTDELLSIEGAAWRLGGLSKYTIHAC